MISLVIAEALADGREVECSVIGNSDPVASEPGEILLAAGEGGWYDYEAKYTPGGMQLIVPARLDPAVRERVRELAVQAFVARPVAAGWPGPTSSSSATRCSSTSSTRCRASPRRACSGRCSPPAGSRIRSCWIGWLALALERHAAERAHRY